MMRLFLEVTKFRLSAAVTLSAVLTFILVRGENVMQMVWSVLAVLLLALGVSALNQYQERESDAKMARTKRRPIPSGRITPSNVLFLSMALIVVAMLLIHNELGNSGLLLFLFVPLWYNGLYTYLKPHSAFTVVPGGLLGVIPPAIGWLAAGRSLAEPEFLALGLLFFIWQVPHFWLLMAKHDEDYRRGGFPTASEVLGDEAFRRVLFVWWTFTILCGIFAMLIFRVHNEAVIALLVALDLTAFFFGTKILAEPLTPSHAGALFHKINFFLLATVVLLSIDGL